jgi:Zn-dependent protease
VNLISPAAFEVFNTAALGVVAVGWLAYDVLNLVKARDVDRADPLVRDRLFGYVMGIVIGVVGVVGVIDRYR